MSKRVQGREKRRRAASSKSVLFNKRDLAGILKKCTRVKKKKTIAVIAIKPEIKGNNH